MERYDYIVTGGGAAGRSLVCQLLKSPLKDKRILLIDRESKGENDRTWCFWEKETGFFEDIVFHSWDKLWVNTHQFGKLLSIAPYSYKMIRGIDFYEYTDTLIDQHPNVERLYGPVESITPKASEVQVTVNGQQFCSDWCFNSIFFGQINKQEVNYLDQHFRGWFIEANSDVFDVRQATLMDFRTPQQKETRFLYVLPYSARKALIEIAIFSNQHLEAEEYDHLLNIYIKQHFSSLNDFQITQVETGNIPMTDYPFPQSEGRLIHIGAAGGDTRASSGYTFFNIQRRVAAIVNKLAQEGHPNVNPSWSEQRARLYDKLMLRVLGKGYYSGEMLFEKLFAKNKPDKILAFLNAESVFTEEFMLMNSLPKYPFFKAIAKEYLHFF